TSGPNVEWIPQRQTILVRSRTFSCGRSSYGGRIHALAPFCDPGFGDSRRPFCDTCTSGHSRNGRGDSHPRPCCESESTLAPSGKRSALPEDLPRTSCLHLADELLHARERAHMELRGGACFRKGAGVQ